jgi:hypothetical protein
MKYQKVISIINIAAGILTILVGGLHFLMIGHLRDWIYSQISAKDAENIFAAFNINHIASGVFLILIGIILTYCSIFGLRHGKLWARIITILIGITISILAAMLWTTVPEMFLEAVAFRAALITLMITGLLIVLPLLVYKKYFNSI